MDSSPPHSQKLTYLSDIRTIKTSAHSGGPDADEVHVTFGTKLVNSARRAISFDRISYYGKYLSCFSPLGFLDVVEGIETGPVETLCFYHYPVHTSHSLSRVTLKYIPRRLRKFQNLKTLILVDCDVTLCLQGLSSCPTIDTLVVHSVHLTGPSHVGVVCRVEEFAVSRKRAGYPLRALTLVFPFVQPCPLELERLMSYVGRVEILGGGNAACWDVDEYLLSAATHESSAGGL